MGLQVWLITSACGAAGREGALVGAGGRPGRARACGAAAAAALTQAHRPSALVNVGMKDLVDKAWVGGGSAAGLLVPPPATAATEGSFVSQWMALWVSPCASQSAMSASPMDGLL